MLGSLVRFVMLGVFLITEEKDSWCLFANLHFEEIGQTKMEDSDDEIKTLVEVDESIASS
jgi:hypothetical protein